MRIVLKMDLSLHCVRGWYNTLIVMSKRKLKLGRRNQAFVAMLVALLAVVGVLVYYFVFKGAVDTANDKETIMQKCEAQPGKDKDLCRFIATWKTQKEYQATITDSAGGKTVYAVNGDRTHIQMSGQTDYESVFDGGTAYVKKQGKWYKQDNVCGGKSCASQVSFITISDDLIYKKIGKEACGDLTCLKYEATAKKDSSNQPKATLWFDSADYKLRHIVSKSADNSADAVVVYKTTVIDLPKNYSDLKDLQAAQANQSQSKIPTYNQ